MGKQCVSRKCAVNIADMATKANDFNLYEHLVKEHGWATNRMQTINAQMLHDMWISMGKMERDCMCKKLTLLQKMAV